MSSPQTGIVAIRPWKKEDCSALASIANNRKIWLNVRDRFPHPYTIGDAISWINFCNGQHPPQNLAVTWGNKLVGSVGMIAGEDVYRHSAEIGYFIGEPFWGKGIATQAVALMLGYMQQHFDLVRVYAMVFQHNTASMQVLQKNGFHLEGIREKAVIKNHVLMNDHVWVKLLK